MVKEKEKKRSAGRGKPQRGKKEQQKSDEVVLSPREKLVEITEKLEQGVKELFESEKYTAYLRAMAKFHD